MADLAGSDDDAKKASEPIEDRLWDDDAFRRRCAKLAQARGVSLRETAIGAKTSADYLTKSQIGRNTNVVMRLARYFSVTPAFLAFNESESAAHDADLVFASQSQIAVIRKVVMLLLAFDMQDYGEEACVRAVETILRRAS